MCYNKLISCLQLFVFLKNRMSSPPVLGVTFSPNKYTSTTCNGVGRRPFKENNMWGNKEESFKLCHTRMSSNRGVRVSSRVQVGTPLINAESKGEEKESATSDGIGIASFIRGKVFLITGATGFLAKVLVEKILRSIPDVGKIYVLIKAENQEAAMQRLKTEVINTELFKSLQEIHGKSYMEFILNKIVPVVGNVHETNIGMEVDIADQITNEVNIIINSAANTTFDPRYDVALEANTLGPRLVLGFAKRCKKLALFMHVSTAYVNGERQGIAMEKPFYKGDSIARERAGPQSSRSSFQLLDVEAEIEMGMDAIKNFDDNTIVKKMKELGLKRARSYGWHDAYAFTKAMGDMLITNEREDIPVVIIRPSTIESTYREPIPGWIQGIKVLDPLIVSYGKGVLTGFPANAKGTLDIIPVDMVVNAMLAAAVKHGRMTEPGLSIYHIASSVANPITYEELFGYFHDYFDSSPYIDPKRKTPIKVQRMKIFSSMNDFNSHIQTEALRRSRIDAAATWRLQKILNSLKRMAKVYEPYTFYGARFDNSKAQKLLDEISEEEKMNFGFDVRCIDWKHYICNIHIPGLMKYVLKGRGMK